MKKYLLATAALAAFAFFTTPRSAEAGTLGPIVSSEMDTPDKANAVFYLGLSSNLYELLDKASGWAVEAATGVPGGPLVGAKTGAEAHVNTVYGRNEVHYLTAVNGSLHVEQLYSDTFFAQDLTVIGSGVAAAPGSNVAGYIDSIEGSDNVFYLGADQHVHLLTWMPAPGWSEDKTLDGTPSTVAALGSPISGHMTNQSDEIFYLGSNHHVYEVWRWSQNFDGWHPIDVTWANGVKPVAGGHSPLAGFYDGVSGNDAIYYIGANHHVYELLFTAPAVWKSVDLTAASGAPNAVNGSTLAAHLNTIPGSEEVFFLDVNDTINILWSWSSPQKFDGWHTYNVSRSAACAPAAAVGSPLSADVNTIDDTDDVYYVAADSNVHELRYDEIKGGWTALDVNHQTTPVAPKAVR